MQHGDKTFDVTAPRSRFYQGGFGRLFPDLKPWKPAGLQSAADLEAAMMVIAKEQMTEAEAADPADPTGNSTLPAGYTYFGQFVDHDIALDATPLSEADIDPNRLHNFRTPRLDLDCVYGQGPKAQPYLYQFEGRRFTGLLRTEQTFAGPANLPFDDLPRLWRPEDANEATKIGPTKQQTALISDPRNDENAIVAHIQLAFLKAHNALVVEASKAGLSGGDAFETARKTLRWLYQWVVWHDYLKRVCDVAVHAHAIKQKDGGPGRTIWEAGYKDVYNWKSKPFMPLEFSVAAYRFGHTLVRSKYRTNSTHGFPKFVDTFSASGENLRGGRALGVTTALQWDWFLPMTSSSGPFPQLARKFDTKLGQALRHLPEHDTKPGDETELLNVLAARNLVRGVRLELPSGTDVARNLNVAPIVLNEGEPDALWFYILKEAEVDAAGLHLGKVGSIIVAATFAGLLLGDPLSFFNIEPSWTPDRDGLLAGLNTDGQLNADGQKEIDANAGTGIWTLASIIRLSGLPTDGAGFPAPAQAPAPVSGGV